MNLYLRYFDNETLVYNVEEAIDFLKSIPEIGMTPELEADVRDYIGSEVYYPKRYKVRPRVYFIIIKTEAATMMDFKQKKALRSNAPEGDHRETVAPAVARLSEKREGWYEASLTFKRVVLIQFVANVKAFSGQDAYNRVVEHLRERVDNRSQFPSAKGKNFKFKYLGMWK